MSQVTLWSTPAIPGVGAVNGIVLRMTARELAEAKINALGSRRGTQLSGQ